WLYKVAYRIALRARAAAARRTAREQPGTDLTAVPAAGDFLDAPSRRELGELLADELARLPRRYRIPLILCDLQGKTQKQAAAELHWPQGSMSRLLTRGRELLRQRLVRRRCVVPTGLLGALLAEQAAVACLRPELVRPTVTAVLATTTAAVEGGVSAHV